MQSKIHLHQSGRTKKQHDPALPQEQAASTRIGKSKLPTEHIPGTRTRNNATRIGDKYMLLRMLLQSDINAATI
ncbi:hypothetical protein Tco_0484459 [Tanacetum coccineum]